MWEVGALVAIAAAVLFALDSLRARERAVRAGRDACRRYELQFLDDTVSFYKVGLELLSRFLKVTHRLEYRSLESADRMRWRQQIVTDLLRLDHRELSARQLQWFACDGDVAIKLLSRWLTTAIEWLASLE